MKDAPPWSWPLGWTPTEAEPKKRPANTTSASGWVSNGVSGKVSALVPESKKYDGASLGIKLSPPKKYW